MTTTLIEARQQARAARPKLSVGLARYAREIHEAQKLRYRIFAGELGAKLPTHRPGVDQDKCAVIAIFVWIGACDDQGCPSPVGAECRTRQAHHG